MALEIDKIKKSGIGVRGSEIGKRSVRSVKNLDRKIKVDKIFGIRNGDGSRDPRKSRLELIHCRDDL